MKRSEMIREIYILLCCGPDYPTEHEILDKIEGLGMLPPYTESKFSEKLVNVWEPE